jgi:hypothetical protein
MKPKVERVNGFPADGESRVDVGQDPMVQPTGVARNAQVKQRV